MTKPTHRDGKTATGRAAAAAPTLQSNPPTKEARAVLNALFPPGPAVLDADYAEVETRVLSNVFIERTGDPG